MALTAETGEYKASRRDFFTIDPRGLIVDWRKNLSRRGQEPPIDDNLIALARDMKPRAGAGDTAEGTSGQIHPIVVRSLPDRRLEVVGGFRRMRAALWLIESGECPDFQIKYTVSKMSDAEAAIANGIENIHREDLSPVQLAHFVRSLNEDYHLEMDAIATRLKRSRAWLEQVVNLTLLPSSIQASIESGDTPVTAGLELAELDGASQVEVFNEARDSNGRVKATEVRKAKRKRQEEAPRRLSGPPADGDAPSPDDEEVAAVTSGKPIKRTMKEVKTFLESRTGPAEGKRARNTASMMLDFVEGRASERTINEFWDKL